MATLRDLPRQSERGCWFNAMVGAQIEVLDHARFTRKVQVLVELHIGERLLPAPEDIHSIRAAHDGGAKGLTVHV